MTLYIIIGSVANSSNPRAMNASTEWNLQVKDTLGSATLSLVEGVVLFSEVKTVLNAMGKGPKRTSFVWRLSFSWRVLYRRFHCNVYSMNQEIKCASNLYQ